MGFKADIAAALKTRIETVTIANGYTVDVKSVIYDNIRVNITEYEDYELPAVQIIDLNKLYNHEMSRSKSSWFLAVEMVLRTTEVLGIVDQAALWNFQEDVMRAIMKEPRLGLNYVQHVKLVDDATDLHLRHPNYIATLGLEIMFYEPVTRDNC